MEKTGGQEGSQEHATCYAVLYSIYGAGRRQDLQWHNLGLKAAHLEKDEVCKKSFKEIKKLLCSDKVLANWELGKETRIYVDDSPAGVAS